MRRHNRPARLWSGRQAVMTRNLRLSEKEILETRIAARFQGLKMVEMTALNPNTFIS